MSDAQQQTREPTQAITGDVHVRPRSPLRWFAAEIVIVVSGVHIALAINAWWEGQQRARETTALRGELRRDIEATRDAISGKLAASNELAANATRVLDAMTVVSRGPQRDSALALTGSVFTLWSWTPVDDTYREAVGSGRLNLITDPETRLALSRYHSQSDRLGTMPDAITLQYYSLLEPFMVEHAVYTDIASVSWQAALARKSPFHTDFDALARNKELWNLITLRLEWEVAIQHHLNRLDSLAVVALNELKH
jgi:hypothetical protein